MTRVDVALLSMPFAPPQRPSLALGILKALLVEAGIATSVDYPSLWFADALGLDLHELLTGVGCQEGLIEWLFAPFAFDDPDGTRDDAAFLERLIQRNPGFRVRNILRLSALTGRARRIADALLDRTVETVLASQPRVVGCTSMFQQHVPSLAVLRRIKARAPEVVTMMGGPNCETRMGQATHRHFPWVDYVVSGEAEDIVVPLVRAMIAHGRDVPPGMLDDAVCVPAHREHGYPSTPGGDGAPRATAADFAAAPAPDHSDYFRTVANVAERERIAISVPIETSRGCWWGATSHCTFCGLNGTSMAFRSKSPDAVLAEISALHARYGVENINAVDNIIDIRYFESVLPELARRALPVRLFYETKSNLRRGQLAAARAANVVAMQPGIESLHSGVLKLMGKGVQAWQNLQYLRFAAEEGIQTIWLSLVGSPGEDDGWHSEAARLYPLLTHLEPGAVARVRYDRFSPNFKNAPARGMHLRPFEYYQHVYPVRGDALFDQAYFFEEAAAPADAGEEGADEPWIAPRPDWQKGAIELFMASAAWKREWAGQHPVLVMTDSGDALAIEDTRSCAPSPHVVLEGLARAVLLAADAAPVEHRAIQQIAAEAGVDRDQVIAAIDALVVAKLLLRLDTRIVALPLTRPSAERVARDRHPLGAVLPRPAKEELCDAAE